MSETILEQISTIKTKQELVTLAKKLKVSGANGRWKVDTLQAKIIEILNIQEEARKKNNTVTVENAVALLSSMEEQYVGESIGESVGCAIGSIISTLVQPRIAFGFSQAPQWFLDAERKRDEEQKKRDEEQKKRDEEQKKRDDLMKQRQDLEDIRWKSLLKIYRAQSDGIIDYANTFAK